MALKVHLMTGKALYAKLVGDPVPGYDEDELEWTVDLVVDKDEQKKYLETGGSPFYIKTHKVTGEEYIRFTRKAMKRDGSPGTRINVVDDQNRPWGDKLIGNGSTLNVSYALNVTGKGKDTRMKPGVLSIQIWELVEYKPKSPFSAKTQSSEDAQNW